MNAQLAQSTQITSFTHPATYTLFFDAERGIAYDCGCPDRRYRGHTCKHMREFDSAVKQAETFLALKRWVEDYPTEAKMNEMAAYYEKEAFLAETARCYRDMMFDPRFQ